MRGMALDHENLDVYHASLDFLVLAESLVAALPRGRSHLADQFTRAALSVTLNIAEGAGKFSPGDKRRYYLSARGSATESAALLDVWHRLGFASEEQVRSGKAMLESLVARLVNLARSQEGRGQGQGQGRRAEEQKPHP
jgi:four helix bundle protein